MIAMIIPDASSTNLNNLFLTSYFQLTPILYLNYTFPIPQSIGLLKKF